MLFNFSSSRCSELSRQKAHSLPRVYHQFRNLQKFFPQKFKKLNDAEQSASYCLTKNQYIRLCGISFLEGGKDTSIIFNELLDQNLILRKNMLSFEMIQKVSKFVDEAQARKWTPQLLITCMTDFINLGITNYPPKLIQQLIQTINILQRSKYLPTYDYVPKQRYTAQEWLSMYKQGKISLEEYIERPKNRD